MEAEASGSPGDVAVDVFRAGALPATLVAGLGDFFAPAGAWVAPLLLGLVAALLLVLFCVYAGLREATLRWLLKPQRAHLWRKPFYRSRVFLSLLVFALVGIVFGSVSQARQQDGGILASRLAPVAALQKMAGIAEETLVEQRRTREGVEQLVGVSRTGLAANPRVTLQNRGVAWTAENLDEALINRDMETVQLFLAGGMGIDQSVDGASDLARFFRNYSPEVAAVLLEHRDRVTEHACLPDNIGFSGTLDDWLVDDARRKLYAGLCDKPGVRGRLQEYAEMEAARRTEVERGNASLQSDRRACKTRLKRDFTMEKAIR